MTAAQRKTPTESNGGSDNGVTYTDLVESEVIALWKVAATYLPTIGGTANAITAISDTALVIGIAAYARPMKFSFKPTANNTSAVTIAIDGLTAKAIKDQDGNALSEDALVAGRLHHIEYDGTDFILDGASSSGSAEVGYGLNGGRLTVTTGVPLPVAAVSAATLLYWTPDVHNQIGLFDGVSAWALLASSEKSIKFTDAQSGATHNGTKVIDNLADTSQLAIGMKISGTNVGGGAVIQSIDSATQVTASINSTGSATNTITFKVPANTGVDIYGRNVASALLLTMQLRVAIHTPTANARQDGVEVRSGATADRYLGAVQTSNTDGQIDYNFAGRYRYTVRNATNKRFLQHIEVFSASGTYYKCLGVIHSTFKVGGAGGGGGTGASGAGGNSSIGSHLAANGGGGGQIGPIGGTAGTASGGDVNRSGMVGNASGGLSNMGTAGGAGALGLGGSGGGVTNSGSSSFASGGGGAASIKKVRAADIAATETVTIGTGGTAGGTGLAGSDGIAETHDMIEV